MVGACRQVNRKWAELPRPQPLPDPDRTYVRSTLKLRSFSLHRAISAMVWVGGHETARGALRIEQRACVAIADQPVFQRREIGEIAGKASILSGAMCPGAG